jgi:hypothetical protein
MKSKTLLMGISVMMVVFGIMLSGCKAEPDEPATYTVWIGTFNFSSDDSDFGSLDDGYYRRVELTQTSFDWEISNNFQNKASYVWTEDQICSYLIGMDFGGATAREQAAWLASVGHGLIGIREGSYLRLLLK